MSEYFDVPFAIALLIAVASTTACSLANSWQVRSWRNLGILACYVLALVFLFVAGWRAALGTWTVFGLAGGLIYFVWDVFQWLRTASGADKPEVQLSTIPLGLLGWPIMAPEAVEYALAELKLLPPWPRKGVSRRRRRLVYNRKDARRVDSDVEQP